MLVAFIRRVLPWLLDRIYDAVRIGWEVIRRRLGW